MKHFVLFAAALFFPALLFAQGAIVSQKDFANLDSKTLKVVQRSSGNLSDMMIRDAVERWWNVSPFEFCDNAEFEASMRDTTCLFLLQASETHKGESEPYGDFLILVKGSRRAGDGLAAMPTMSKLLLCPHNDQSDFEVYLPLYIKAMQYQLKERAASDSPLPQIGYSVKRIPELEGHKVLVCIDDIAEDVDSDIVDARSEGLVELVSRDRVESAVSSGEDVVVARSVTVGGSKSYCYKMLVDASTGRVYYYVSQRLLFGLKSGFSRREIRQIISAADGR